LSRQLARQIGDVENGVFNAVARRVAPSLLDQSPVALPVN